MQRASVLSVQEKERPLVGAFRAIDNGLKEERYQYAQPDMFCLSFRTPGDTKGLTGPRGTKRYSVCGANPQSERLG